MHILAGELTNTDHCQVVAKIRVGLAVSQHEAQKFDVERFSSN